MSTIIFKDGLYNGIDREIRQGENAIYVSEIPYTLEKISDGKIVSFNTNPYIFTEEDILSFKSKIVTNDTFCNHSKIMSSSAENNDIAKSVGVHLSRDGFIIEPNGEITFTTTLDEPADYIKLFFKGSYISELTIKCELEGDEVSINSLREVIVDTPSDDLKLVIKNPTEKVIIITELTFIY